MSKNLFDGWTFQSYYGGRRRLRNQRSHSALFIQNLELDDSRYIKNFQLQPYTNYIATVHVVAENIKVQEGPEHTHIGVNLSLMDSWIHSSDFNDGVGDNIEGDLTLKFQTNDTGKVTIALRLGFYCSEATGSATFQNFQLKEDDSRIILGTSQIRLNVSGEELQELPSILDHCELFLTRMETAYNTMSELYNKYPFDHKVIFYETRPGIRAWAFAGNPIVWNSRCFIDYFRQLDEKPDRWADKQRQKQKQQNNNSNFLNTNLAAQNQGGTIYDPDFFDNACFGTIHEMGHNFDMSGFGRINHELGANFNLCYAVEANNFPIYFDDELTFGRGLQDGFYRRVYEKTIGNKEKRCYNHDALLYCLLRIKDRVGWDPYKRVFARYAVNNPPGDLNHQKLLELLINELSREARFDVRQTFPEGELEFIMKQDHF